MTLGEEKLEKICSLRKGKNVIQSEILISDYLPLVNMEFVKGVINTWADSHNAVTCIEEDVLMLWDGERSGFVTIGQRGVVGSTFSKFEILDKEKIHNIYLYYFLQNKFEWIQNRRTGTGVPHVPKDLKTELCIIYPTNFHEQQKIASILSTIDKNIELTEQLIAKQKNIKTGLMHDLLSYGIDESGQIRSPQTHSFVEKNGIAVPEEWECKSISEVINIINGGTPSTSNPLFWNGDIYWLSVDDFNKGERFVYKAQKTITSLGLQKSSTNILKKGEIIISARGTVGVIAQIGTDMAFNQSCYGISLKSEEIYSNDYIYYFLYFYFKESKVITAGSTFDTIKKSTFDEIYIFFSKDKQEQVKIISLLTKQDQIISEQETKLEKLKLIKKGLMEDLLTGKVRVNY
ncbi:MAG: restriction endonuclease subunit S [Prevotella sp.]|jgi:type I restriction enzyme S subunit|nr:restriction endonuclease subunit S [Prevotella sp.]